MRIEPGDACKRGAPIRFKFDGRAVDAFEGETLGAALWAADERVLMRSIKYHRPRGLFCNTGKCANCLVRVDGSPNVRACVTPCHEGAVVETQNAFPSARRDLFAIVDKVYRKNFDYHQKFIRPKIFTPIYHRVIRGMAGFGKIPDLKPLTRRPKIVKREVDVLVVGAGPAGLGAARAAREAGASVLVVDESDLAGGSLLIQGQAALAKRLASDLEILVNSTAIGVYLTDGTGGALPTPGTIPVLTPQGIVEVKPKALVVASGYHETPGLFPGNDLPGVMGARAALILLHRHGIVAGQRVLVASAEGLGLRAMDDLAKAGADVRRGTVVEARGGTRVEKALLADGHHAEVDLVLTSGDESPRVELLQQAGVPLVARGNALVPKPDAVPGVFAAGEVLGVMTSEAALESGRGEVGPAMTTPKCLVCTCEDVSDVELREAIGRGCADLESLKRYTGFGTGPCQGKACVLLARRILSEETGQDVASLGAITFRAPVQPVALRFLAGEEE